MEIKIVRDTITKSKLARFAKNQFGDLVKVVVDVEKGLMAIGGELHADGEVLLMEQEGSKREHTWGLNLYPGKSGEDWIEFDSLINIKPQFGNRSRGVDNPEIRERIKGIVNKLISESHDPS